MSSLGWIFRMAWRDSRRQRSRLFLFISSIVLGIASLVAIQSFNEDLSRTIDAQAAQLLGADLELRTNRRPSDEVQRLVDSLSGLALQSAHERQFMSMVQFPQASGSRLIQVRALSGGYPFYGGLASQPAEASSVLADQHSEESSHGGSAHEASALVDETLMLQFQAQVGDSLQLGLTRFRIAGSLGQQPGQLAISQALAPSILVPLRSIQDSGLEQPGSRITYKYYFQFAEGFPVDHLAEGLDSTFRELHLRWETIETNKQDTGRSFEDMSGFMSLVGFIALLLGCIGVSSAVHIYVREKLVSVAILRCLGASTRQTFWIFLVQFAGIGLLGGLIGAALGSLIQFLLPWVMQSFLPVTLSSTLSWTAIAEGIGVGVIISVLFALLPLLAVRQVSPLHSLRVSDETTTTWKDPVRWVIYVLIGAFVVLFSYVQLGDWATTAAFSMGIGVVFFIFYAVAQSVTYFLHRFFPSGWPYVWRQGLANLYRPQNQTIVLLMAIGFGTALIATLFFSQSMLLQRIAIASDEKQANILMFDIQASQLEEVEALTRQAGYPVVERVPIVTVEILGMEGRRNREIRATFRSELSPSEHLVSGKWVPEVAPGEPAQVSLEAGYARRIGVSPGDEMLFNVQGVSVPAIVSSTREVDWNQFSTNFRLVFARGTIDQAPRTYVLMSLIEDPVEAARFQQEIVQAFPNISVIDIYSVITVLGELMARIGFVIQFIGGFSILTGIVVLIASIRISKYQRLRENVLLRTLGASRRQIYLINLSEYLFLGFLAALVGLIISLGASALIGYFLFELRFTPPLGTIALLILAVTLLCTLIGLLNSRSTLNRPPLESLRS